MRTTHAIFFILALLSSPLTSRAQISLLSDMENDHDVLPGGAYTGTITVRNTTDTPRAVRVYQQDSRYVASGAEYVDPGTLPRSNAEWISFAPSTFTVPAQENVTLTYTISVPDDDSLRGSYWSVLMVESVISEPQTAKSSSKEGQIRLGVKFRYAVQVAAHVGGGQFDLAVSNFKTDVAADSVSVLQLDLRNDGERMRDAEVWVEVYDDGGNLVGRFEGVKKRLYPGCVQRQRFDLGSLQSGEYNALVLVDAGADELFGAQYTIQL